MSIVGKVVGGIAGLLLFHNPLGMLLGIVLGHWYDGMAERRRPALGSGFIEPLFAYAGALAKSDGRVSESEISAAEALMARLNLDATQRSAAMAQFIVGKQRDYNNSIAVAELKVWCRGRRDHAFIVLDLLLDLVYAEGLIVQPKLVLVQKLCSALGVSEHELVALSAMKGYGPAWHQAQYTRYSRASGQARGSHQGGRPQPPPRPSDVDPYAVLGITSAAGDGEIKRAYRKLMSQHHPDKLVGVPDEVRRRSEERAREINAAYERIKQERGLP